MCIAYVMDHARRRHGIVQCAACIGVYFCRSIFDHDPCPAENWHQFHLEESGYGCPKCIASVGDKLDPDATPVQYYPPVEDFDIAYVREGAFDRVVKVSRDVYQRSEGSAVEVFAHSEASLSDVDSETSHWKEDWTMDEEDGKWGCCDEPTLSQEESSMTVAEDSELPVASPKTTQHRDLEQDQAEHLPQHLVPQETEELAPSPNTTQHRELILDQLAHLPSYLAHCRQHTHAPVGPAGPPLPFYDPPVVATPVVPVPGPFYNGVLGGEPRP